MIVNNTHRLECNHTFKYGQPRAPASLDVSDEFKRFYLRLDAALVQEDLSTRSAADL